MASLESSGQRLQSSNKEDKNLPHLSRGEAIEFCNDQGRCEGPIGEEFAVWFLKMRRARGLTLGQIARGLGVSTPSVWAWENGKSKPRAVRMEQLCRFFESAGGSSLPNSVRDGPRVASRSRSPALLGDRSSVVLPDGLDTSNRNALTEAGKQLIAQAWNVDVRSVRLWIDP